MTSSRTTGSGPKAGISANESDRTVGDALAKVRKRIGSLGWDILHDRLQEYSPKTLAELGERWRVSREWVRQVELKSKLFLRGYLRPLSVGTAA